VGGTKSAQQSKSPLQKEARRGGMTLHNPLSMRVEKNVKINKGREQAMTSFTHQMRSLLTACSALRSLRARLQSSEKKGEKPVLRLVGGGDRKKKMLIP